MFDLNRLALANVVLHELPVGITQRIDGKHYLHALYPLVVYFSIEIKVGCLFAKGSDKKQVVLFLKPFAF